MRDEVANLVLADHGIDPQRGFLPPEDPLTTLSAEYAPWEAAVADLPQLLVAGRVRQAVHRLPPLDTRHLSSAAEYNRAMLLLSYLGQSYVFGTAEPADHIPAVLAQPWHSVAAELGRHPVLSYGSYALSNWRRFDPAEPIALGNIARLTGFYGGLDEDWFVLIHVAIEATAGPGLLAAVRAQCAAAAGDGDGVAAALTELGDTLERMLAILHRITEHCDPYIYYTRVRQFSFGWKDNPALPDGVWYEGVPEYQGRPQKFRGETGAQSTIIPAFDAVLGLDLSTDPLGAHVIELREYMPPQHRAFLRSFQSGSAVRDLAERHRGHVAESYNRCVELIATFRKEHLHYAATYIRGQRQGSVANPIAIGTGGTPFMRYLADHVNATRDHRLCASTS